MDYSAIMSSLKIVELVLDGNIPSKKNSRINTREGKSFPSKKFQQWQNDAIKMVRSQTRQRFYNPVALEVIVYFGTDAIADLDNKVTSILDMLVECLVLRDDRWQYIPQKAEQAEYRPGKPGAFIRITELPADILGAELAATRAKRRPKQLA